MPDVTTPPELTKFTFDDLGDLLDAYGSLSLDDLSLTTRRNRIVALIHPFRACYEIAGAKPWTAPDAWRREEELRADEPCVLIVQGSDSSGGVSFQMVPRSKCDGSLSKALDLIDGRTFAGPADLRREQWDAAVRYMAASGEGGASVQAWIDGDLSGWDDGERGVPDDEILEIYDRWRGCDVNDLSGLDRHVDRVITLRRAE